MFIYHSIYIRCVYIYILDIYILGTFKGSTGASLTMRLCPWTKASEAGRCPAKARAGNDPGRSQVSRLPRGSNVVLFGVVYDYYPYKKIGHNQKGATVEPLGKTSASKVSDMGS